jgi:hypothetical protein
MTDECSAACALVRVTNYKSNIDELAIQQRKSHEDDESLPK